MSILMLALSELLAETLSGVFVGYDAALHALTTRAFMIYSLSFLFSGLAIYGSAFFTALNNGLISALISFLRTLLFQTAAVLLLPLFMGIDGVWWSIVASETLAALVTVSFMAAKRREYGY